MNNPRILISFLKHLFRETTLSLREISDLTTKNLIQFHRHQKGGAKLKKKINLDLLTFEQRPDNVTLEANYY